MSSDELRDCNDISRKEVFCGTNMKKKTQNILCVTWYLCRGKKEGKKEAAYLKPADVEAPLGLFQLLDLHSILRRLLRIWRQPDYLHFWCFKRKWWHGAVSTYHLLQHKDHRFVITVVIIVVTSLSDIWKERMGCCDDDDADDDKHQAYQIFQNLKREAWF